MTSGTHCISDESWSAGRVYAMLCSIVLCLTSGTAFATALYYRLCLLISLLWEYVRNLIKNYCLSNLDFLLCLDVTFQIVSFFVKIDVCVCVCVRTYVYMYVYMCVCVSEFRTLFGKSTFCSVQQRRQKKKKQCTHFSRFSFKVCFK